MKKIIMMFLFFSNMAIASEHFDMYRQKEYLLEDSVGDQELFNIILTFPHELYQGLFKKNPYSDVNASKEASNKIQALENSNPQIKINNQKSESSEKLTNNGNALKMDGRENPLKVKQVIDMIIEIVTEEDSLGIHPTVGDFHKWSPEVHANNRGPYAKFTLRYPKILMALAAGVTSRFMISGHEDELSAWLLLEPNGSVTLDKMFRSSYQICNGNVYLSLLTIENVLSQFWRAPNRESIQLTRRLKSFTIKYGGDNDKFGSWYHFFGVVLYGYVTDEKTSATVGKLETLGGQITGRRGAYQKEWINKLGGPIGAGIRLRLEKNILSKTQDSSRLLESYYLNQFEDFRDRLPIKNEPSLKSWLYNTNELLLLSSKKERKNCKIELMIDQGDGLNSSKKQVLENQNLSPKLVLNIQLKHQVAASRPLRGFVSNCDDGLPEQAFEINAEMP